MTVAPRRASSACRRCRARHLARVIGARRQPAHPGPTYCDRTEIPPGARMPAPTGHARMLRSYARGEFVGGAALFFPGCALTARTAPGTGDEADDLMRS